MASEARARARNQAGFTLVEILVVMLILGLLAAIAIPAFFGQRSKARDAEAKLQVRTAQTALETYATERNGTYNGASPAALQAIEPTLREIPAGNLTVNGMGNSGQFRISVISSTGNEFWIRRENDGTLSYPCTTQGLGGCPSGGIWAP